MYKSLLLRMLSFILLLVIVNETTAQQRTFERVESIVLKHKQKHKINNDYLNNVRSTDVVGKSALAPGKEAFYIYQTTGCENKSFVR